MFSYVFLLTMALHILSVQCARKENCPANGFRSVDTNECYCNVDGTLQLCRRQSSKGARSNSASQKLPSKHRSNGGFSARKENCPANGFRSVDTNECYCNVDGTLQLCRRQSSKGARSNSASQKLPSKHRSNGGFSARIVGGVMATISDHPYMLAMEVWGILKCGATIIGHLWAVTAAHCIVSTKYLAAIQLRAHTEDLFHGGETFSVIEAIVHEGFQPEYVANDIALIKADRPFEWGGRNFEPALLPDTWQELTEGTMVTVVGWGNTYEHGYPSSFLQEVELPIVSLQYCQSIHGDQITPAMICAGFPEGKKDACQADSGGPMMYYKTIVGIVSSGDGCARANNPGVYTKVSAMREWIREKIHI